MKYSVYDYTRRAYDYYEAPGPGGTHAGSPAVARSLGQIGTAPDRASWRLPLGAKRVGSGERPQGRIASLGSMDLTSNPLRLGILAVLAYVGWRALQ